jgi:hypothetical protein
MLRISLLLALPLVISGCPFGDCFPDWTITVMLAEGIDAPSGEVMVVSVSDIGGDDVTGTNAQGIPEGPAAEMAEPSPISAPPPGGRTTATYEQRVPYETWHYAFVDLDGNGVLSSGDPFGVSDENPIDRDCDSYETTIVIDGTYP